MTPSEPMVQLIEAITPEAIEQARRLFREHEAEFASSIQDSLCFQRFDDEVADLPGKYARPTGRLILAIVSGQPVGCVGLRDLGEGASEMKRLFVQPRHRGQKLGAALIQHVMNAAREEGYRWIRLDTVPEMDQAIRVYRSMGFQPIPPYWNNAVGKALYFEADLSRV